MEHPALKPLRELRARITERYGVDIALLGFIDDAELAIAEHEAERTWKTLELTVAAAEVAIRTRKELQTPSQH